MKRFLLLMTMVAGFTISGFAQKEKSDQAPDVAKTAFAKAFPGASKVKWEKEKADYEVNFEQDGQEMSAVYDSGGALKETEVEIKASQLPAGVLDYIKLHYKNAKVKEIAKITKAGGEVNYEAEVNKTDVLFDANGKFLKEEKEEEDKD
jgi:hypothetical protein